MAAEVAQQDTASVPPPSPSVVGQAFAAQYYTILHQSPGLVHRFYQDISKFGRLDDDGNMSLTTRMADINEKILSYGTLKAEIKSVDAQESYNGGVVLLITGTMTKEDESKQEFIQTFFLAPQDKGYFVLNDIFRFVDNDKEEDRVEAVPNGEAAPDAPAEDVPPVQPLDQVDQSEEVTEGEVYDPSEDGEGSVVEQEEPVAAVVHEAPKQSETVVESESKAEEGPKKSYASIVKVMRESAAPVSAPSPIKSTPKPQAAPANSAPPPSVNENPNPNPNLTEDVVDQDGEGDGRSIYVRNLPLNANPATVKEAFKTFGPIKNGGIQVRTNKGFCFGFVEFEDPASAQTAIEAASITMGGQQVGIEEKKSTNSRVPGNRGRFPSGRGGGGFRNEGPRGRGNYGGGRGYGRGGDSGRSGYGNRGNGRGGYQNRNTDGYQNRNADGYQKDNQMGNGGVRTNNRAPGNTGINMVAKTQRVSASA